VHQLRQPQQDESLEMKSLSDTSGLFTKAVEEQILNSKYDLEDMEDTNIFLMYLNQLEGFYRRNYWKE
jgi:hypothetical protein